MKILRTWGPVVVWMIVIFAFSSRQRVSVSSDFVLNFLFFKMLHVLEYSMLYALFYRAYRLTHIKNKKAPVAQWAFWSTVLYAVTDELHQTMVPTREGAPRDVIIDAGGAFISWLILTRLLPKAPKKLTMWVKTLGFQS